MAKGDEPITKPGKLPRNLQNMLDHPTPLERPEDECPPHMQRYVAEVNALEKTGRLNRHNIWLRYDNLPKEVLAKRAAFRTLSHYPKGFWIIGQIMPVPRALLCDRCKKKAFSGSWQYWMILCWECGDYVFEYELQEWPWWKRQE